MKKALMVSTIIGFLSAFEVSDIKLLQSLGYEVHCGCNCDYYADESRVQRLMETGIIKHHIPFTRKPFSKANITAYKALKKLIKSERFDLVHCHTPVGGVLGRMAAHGCHVPMTVYTAHGFHFFKGSPIKNKMMFYPVEKYLSRYTDILITINNEDFDLAKAKFHAKRTERIHGVGIDIGRFNNKSDCRIIKRTELGVAENETMLLSVGELDRDKNHIEVLEAMKSLAPLGYKFFIAGNGGLRESYNEFIRKNGLDKSVKLLGFRTDIPELLQASDIYVFPSLFEGLSVALMEAVAAHLPIACSKVRGNVDTVVSVKSYFDPKDSSTLVTTIKRISAMTYEEKNKMTEINYQNLLKYRLSKVRKEMNAIYKIADKTVERGVKK